MIAVHLASDDVMCQLREQSSCCTNFSRDFDLELKKSKSSRRYESFI